MSEGKADEMGFSRGFRVVILWAEMEKARVGRFDVLAATTRRGTVVAILRNILIYLESSNQMVFCSSNIHALLALPRPQFGASSGYRAALLGWLRNAQRSPLANA